jgi:hypothetical protein
MDMPSAAASVASRCVVGRLMNEADDGERPGDEVGAYG